MKPSGHIRLILDLSQPRGTSVNDGILDEFCSVRYSIFDDAVRLASAVGVSAMMAKIDIMHAFRLCPVRMVDRPLLCFQWNNLFFVDTRLPFGCRTSPAIFNTFADALAWILISCGGIYYLVHYLDDFLMCAPDKATCSQWMTTFNAIFFDIGVPIAREKTVGPSTKITYLGIEIDTVAQCIRLPADKYDALTSLLKEWRGKQKCTKRELLSLIGSLSFAAKVVKSGRLFLRRLIDLSTSVNKLHHHISLNSEARADISWWIEFMPSWNGIALFQEVPVTSIELDLFTDASKIGCGGMLSQKWFSLAWPNKFLLYDINFLELFAIYVAISTWGVVLANKQIMVFCDNLDVVTIWRSGTCKNKHIMNLMRKLFFVCASHNINLFTHHIPGHCNILADHLSRLQMGKFRHGSAEDQPSIVPGRIWDI